MSYERLLEQDDDWAGHARTDRRADSHVVKVNGRRVKWPDPAPRLQPACDAGKDILRVLRGEKPKACANPQVFERA